MSNNIKSIIDLVFVSTAIISQIKKGNNFVGVKLKNDSTALKTLKTYAIRVIKEAIPDADYKILTDPEHVKLEFAIPATCYVACYDDTTDDFFVYERKLLTSDKEFFGKLVFLDKEEAEKKVERMKEDNK